MKGEMGKSDEKVSLGDVGSAKISNFSQMKKSINDIWYLFMREGIGRKNEVSRPGQIHNFARSFLL